MATVAAWLATQGASLLLGFLANVIKDWWTTYSANQAQLNLGRVTSERDQAVAGNEARDRMLNATVAAPRDVDEAAALLDKGGA